MCKFGAAVILRLRLLRVTSRVLKGDTPRELDGECVQGAFPAEGSGPSLIFLAYPALAVDIAAGYVPDSEVEQLDRCVVVGEMAPVLRYLRSWKFIDSIALVV